MTKTEFNELSWRTTRTGAHILLDGPYYASIYPPGWMSEIMRHLPEAQRNGWFVVAEKPTYKERMVNDFPKETTLDEVKSWIYQEVFDDEEPL